MEKNQTLFHKLIVDTSNNSRLIQFAERLSIQAQRFKHLTILVPSRYSMVYEEHSAMLEAIECNSIEKAYEAILTHTENSKKNYSEILNNNMWLRMLKTIKK